MWKSDDKDLWFSTEFTSEASETQAASSLFEYLHDEHVIEVGAADKSISSPRIEIETANRSISSPRAQVPVSEPGNILVSLGRLTLKSCKHRHYRRRYGHRRRISERAGGSSTCASARARSEKLCTRVRARWSKL